MSTEAVLRPSGDLGDSSDLTYVTISDGAREASDDGTLPVTDSLWYSLAGLPNEGWPLSIVVTARVYPDVASQGPADPTAMLYIREGAGAEERLVLTEALNFQGATPFDLESESLIAALDGRPWSWDTLSGLQVCVRMESNEAGSHIATDLLIYELSVVLQYGTYRRRTIPPVEYRHRSMAWL